MNKDLFKSNVGNVKAADVTNEAGGAAYALSDKLALAQLSLTGTLHNTFYAKDEDQLKTVLELANKLDVEYVAKVASYAHRNGGMKDVPALLLAVVAAKKVSLLPYVFDHVIDTTKMMRNFSKVIRSNVVGRKSFGTRVKKLLIARFDSMTDEQVWRGSIGNDPSMADCIRMFHPKAKTPSRNALYAYLLGKEYDKNVILPLINEFEAFKKDMTLPIPNAPFEILTALQLTDDHWKSIARNATWSQIRQNLNTFARHNVFNDKEVKAAVLAKLQDPEQVRRARAFPYQLFATYMNVDDASPDVKVAIQKAAEVSMDNVPAIEGDVEICIDVSGSMQDPVTGHRVGATSKMKCIDVAAMFAAAVMRKNPLARVTPFDTAVRKVDINPMDSVMTNAEKLAIRGGGTDCGCALAYLNQQKSNAKAVIYVSDNQSFAQSTKTSNGETPMAREWETYKRRVNGARLINIDIAPYTTAQLPKSDDTLFVGGFSDAVFGVIASFVKNENPNTLVDLIENEVSFK